MSRLADTIRHVRADAEMQERVTERALADRARYREQNRSNKAKHGPYRRGRQDRRALDKRLHKRLVTAGAVCAHCGTSENLQVSHVVPVEKDGTDADSNLQVLCLACHTEYDHPLLGTCVM